MKHPRENIEFSSVPKANMVAFNVRLEPSLKNAIEAATFGYSTPGGLIRRCAANDVTQVIPEPWDSPQWIVKEGRSTNLTFAVRQVLGEAIHMRAIDRHLSITDYFRALGISAVLEKEKQLKNVDPKLTILDKKSEFYVPALTVKKGGKKWWRKLKGVKISDEKAQELFHVEPEEVESASGYTIYKGKAVVDFVREQAEIAGLSLAAYQKMLVFQDIAKWRGMKFLNALVKQSYEPWEMNEGILRRMLEELHRKRTEANQASWEASEPTEPYKDSPGTTE
ncbi:MAG TPA: hypothetical protein VI895_07420 [Bdellovibrionota bacterium]|nr:hypothetical protein [Bdellovibrionota bacterium]